MMMISACILKRHLGRTAYTGKTFKLAWRMANFLSEGLVTSGVHKISSSVFGLIGPISGLKRD